MRELEFSRKAWMKEAENKIAGNYNQPQLQQYYENEQSKRCNKLMSVY